MTRLPNPWVSLGVEASNNNDSARPHTIEHRVGKPLQQGPASLSADDRKPFGMAGDDGHQAPDVLLRTSGTRLRCRLLPRDEERQGDSPLSPDLLEDLLPGNSFPTILLHRVEAVIQFCLLGFGEWDLV